MCGQEHVSSNGRSFLHWLLTRANLIDTEAKRFGHWCIESIHSYFAVFFIMSDTIVIDGKGHLLGRLASIVAKQLLFGKKVVVVRAEALLISGSCKFRPAVTLSNLDLLLMSCCFICIYSDQKQDQICSVHQEENEHQPQTRSFPLQIPRENFLENCKSPVHSVHCHFYFQPV